MKVHIYDFLNKNKLAQLEGEEFLGIDINLNIDDFSTATLTYNVDSKINNIVTQGLENIYIEDDDENIIFGGTMVSFTIGTTLASITLYDHRWVFSRLILDEERVYSIGEDLLDLVEDLVNTAKAKREIPIEFDRDGSAVNPAFNADLRFEVGDDIGSSLQKIIQTVYARWAVRYFKDGSDIFGKLVVRSVIGVTPEGVGISRGFDKSEDGDIVHLYYGEGDETSNIADLKVTQDFLNYTSRSKLGAKIDGESKFFNSTVHLTNPFVAFLEATFGRTEGYSSDYKANSTETGQALADLNQNLLRLDATVILSPDFKTLLRPGDRVAMSINSPMIEGISRQLVRVDSVTYSRKDGYFERSLLINFMSPQKRPGTTGFIQAVSDMQQKLDGLDKNYFNNS